jgi:predicted aspartyl protease
LSRSVSKCWPHLHGKPPSPSITVVVSASEKGEGLSRMFQVDTGFSGAVAIDQELIDLLDPQRIGSIHIATATNLDVRTDLYLLYLTIPEMKISRQPFAALRATRCLIGRQLLDHREWMLDNVRNRFCLLS